MIDLSVALDSNFLRVLGAIYAVITLLLWLWVGSRTVALIYSRAIFEGVPELEFELDKSSMQSGSTLTE